MALSNNKKGFTLAETLTTVLLIGVIAAFTIPSLITGIDNQKNQNMLKKLHSAMSVNIQTVLNQAALESLSDLRAWGKTEGKHNGILGNPVYFNIDHECTNCFAQNKRDAKGTWSGKAILPGPMDAGNAAAEAVVAVPAETDEEGNIIKEAIAAQDAVEATDANFTTYRLKNGSWAAIYDFEGNCNMVLPNVSTTRTDEYGDPIQISLCAIVVFDTNAEKAPNSPGYDRFAYYISDKPINDSYLIPIGHNGASDKDNNSQYNTNGYLTSIIGDGTCKKGELSGYNCTAQMMMKGWKLDEL